MKRIAFCIAVASLSWAWGEAADSSFYVGPVWNFVNSHWGNGTKQVGSLWGVMGGYTYAKRESVYANAEFNYMAGMLKGSAGHDPTQEYITQIRLGYNMVSPLWDRFLITPFLGIGAYIFNQSLAGDATFQSHFWYVPIGVLFDIQITDHWKIGFMGSGSPPFAGRWRVDKTKDAPVTVLWKGELPISYVGLHSFTFSLVPFIKSWGFEHKEDLIKQINNYYGIQALAGYRF